MSTEIEQRVVEMQFDNKQFERNVSTTMSSLDKLKQSLNLTGAAKGLESVGTAAKGVNLSGLTSAAETVGLKFNAMYTIADQALRNITNSAYYAGKRIVSALTIDPVKTGLSEYETQINAVQTILANTESKGTTLKDVNGALDELNTYADKTIYNFTEMTRNIGTFTAAGVDLDTSVNAIQGIANLAAVSGSSSQQASTAMYQLSQAMASGTVKLMDWNSVVNAGMGGQVFQDALKETAKVHGINVDKMIEKHGSFRETLQEGWITTDILTETLSHFTMAAEEGSKEWEAYKKTLKDQGYSEAQANAILKMSNTATDAATKVKTATQLFDTLKETAQSGWTQTWELLFGDFEDAKTLFSGLYETFAPILEASAKTRNELLQGWADAGGRDDLIESMYNIFEGIGSVVKPIKEAFSEIFPPMTAERLVNITKAIKEFTEKLTLSETTSDNLKRTFKGLFAVLDIVKQALGAVFKAVSPLFGKVDNLGGGILGVTAKFGDWLVKLDESIKTSGFFTAAVEKIHAAIKKIGDFLKPAAEGIKKFSNEISKSLTAASSNAKERLGPLAVLGNFIKSIFVGIGNIVQKVFPYVSAAAKGIGNVLKDLMNTIADSIQNANYDSLFDLTSGGILTAIGVYITKFFKSGSGILDGASGFVENLNGILEGAGDALGAFTDSLKADTLKKIATAIAILAASLLVLSLIPSEKLTASLLAVAAMFGELMASVAIFDKIGPMKGAARVATSLMSLSAAVLVLSVALKIMSTMSWSEMGVGLISLTVGIGALVGAVNLLPDRKVKAAAKAIKSMSSAILILAVGIKIMSTMSWEEMGVGLISMVVGLGALVGAVRMLPKDTALRAAGMVGLATAMVVLGAALKIMATMSWGDIARSLVTLAGSLGILAAAMALMKKAIPGALAMMIIAPSLIVLAGALHLMGNMSWDSIARGLVTLGGSLVIIATAMALMKKALPGAAALLVVAASLAILTPVLMALGSMSLAEIGKSLLVLAGTFTVFGLAALILKPLVGTMIALAGSLTLLGIACAAIGAGVLMVGLGITALAAALATGGGAITIFVSSLISLIPFLIEQIGVGIIRLCKVIAGSAAAICEAATVIIVALVDALVASVPAIVEGALVLVEELLKSLAKHTPMIVSALFDFLIGLINAIADRLPDLIKAGVNLLMSFFVGVIEALKQIDPSVLVNGILAIGLVTALMAALSACAAMVPAAIVGVLGVGAVIAELAIVFAAIGALAQIPGLKWLISEGGDFMQLVGSAIGKFIGGIIGGIAGGISSALPQIGDDLSDFMENIQPFIAGAKSIDSASLSGVRSLVDIILALTGASVLEGLTSWFTGGSSLAKFGEEIAAFGPCIRAYADSVAGIDPAAVVASANAAKALADMASCIPNEGGVVAWFAGENSISKFGDDLVVLGDSLSKYSASIVNFNAEAVIASANAAKALAEMTSCIPNSGGVVAWFTGDNSISKFGDDLVVLGDSLSKYSQSIAGFNGEAVVASANAAKALADMTSCIPNSGGVVAWFTGENSISKFGNDLVALGISLSRYSQAIADFNAEAVIASANAAKALVDMTSCIPNEGGLVAWFTGENSISKFGADIVALGVGLKGFSDAIIGINIEAVTAAAGAAKSLAEMTSFIPNEGGIVSWFTGENSISKFGADIVSVGVGIKGFSDAVSGINPENVIAAANAAKALAEMTSYIPNSGGVVSWFTGESSISKFATDIISLGGGIKGFSDAVTGIVPENVVAAASAAKSLAEMTMYIPNSGGIAAWFTGESSLSKFSTDIVALGVGLKGFSDAIVGIVPENVVAAADAAKSIAEMSTYVPNSGGIKAWFTGESSLSKFAADITSLGVGLKGFSDSIVGIVPENVVAAANAAKALAEMTQHIPSEGGIKAWFTGESSISNFAGKLPVLGAGLKGFSNAIVGINPKNITAAADAAKSLAQMTESTPGDTNKLVTFGENLSSFGGKLKNYFTKISGITPALITTSSAAIDAVKDLSSVLRAASLSGMAKAINSVTQAMNKLSKIKASAANGFSSAIAKLSTVNINSVIKAFDGAGPKLKKIGQSTIDRIIDGMNAQKNQVAKAGEAAVKQMISGMRNLESKLDSTCKNLVKSGSDTISRFSTQFKSAGKDLGSGLVVGINSKQLEVYMAAYKLGQMAVKGEKDGQKSNSPSKLTILAGNWLGEGLIIGMNQMGRKVYNAGSNLGQTASSTISSAISKLSNTIYDDIDTQPTIRPILDLSDVKAGTGVLSGMLRMDSSVGIRANVSAISSMMSNRGQNGTNADVVSAIDKLYKKMDNMGNTTNNIINGVTYDDGSTIHSMLADLIQAIKMEGRA